MRIYGIDLSKEKFDVCFVDKTNKEKMRVVNNSLRGIEKFIETLSEDAHIVAEHTGVYGNLLVFMCNQINIPISLVPGYSIKHSLGMVKGKSDPLDSRRIREYGIRFSDKLNLAKYHTEEMAELKEYHALRSQLVRAKKILSTSEKGRRSLPYQSIGVYKYTKSSLDALNQEIINVEKEMEYIITSNKELCDNYKLATSVPGIGHVITTELIIKTDNFKKIDTSKKAASYVGVCPFPNSSGKMKGKTKTSNMGDKSLKSLLYMGAKAAVKHNPEYRYYFQRKTLEGKEYFLIMNNVSNKLLRTVYCIIKNNKPYDKNYVSKDPRGKLIKNSENKVA